jgi:hypothetical protein
MSNPTILPGSTRSTWSVTKDGAAAGTIYLFTSDGASRVDLVDPPADNIVFIGRDGKVWRRDGQRDVDYATWRISGHVQTPDAVLPSLLLPFLTDPRAAVELSNGKLYKYNYRAGSALYTKDADSRPKKIDVLSGGRRYVLERQTVEEKTHDPSIFALRS